MFDRPAKKSVQSSGRSFLPNLDRRGIEPNLLGSIERLSGVSADRIVAMLFGSRGTPLVGMNLPPVENHIQLTLHTAGLTDPHIKYRDGPGRRESRNIRFARHDIRKLHDLAALGMIRQLLQ